MKNGTYDCPFCSTEIKKRVIGENELMFAIYDIYPVSNGHVLVIPKRHCSSYFELSTEEQAAGWSLINEMQQKLKKEFNPDGFNIGVNIGEAAGQTVWHAHFHLIPRYSGDMENPRGGVRHCVAGKGYY